MKVLFIGGTGIISTACTKLAVARGFDVTLLNRSLRGGVPGARTGTADVSDPGAADRALSDGYQSLFPDQFRELADECRAIADLLSKRRLVAV